MRPKKLSERLAVMADFVKTGESVADVGADHGYLPLFLVREGVSPFAILTDIKPGPLEKTRHSARKSGVDMETKIEFRLGDGLSAIKKAEVDVVVIAGMGGETICSILAADPEKTISFRKYILQPRTKIEVLKEWLFETGWQILRETTAEERGRFCDIIVCEPRGKL